MKLLTILMFRVICRLDFDVRSALQIFETQLIFYIYYYLD